MDRTLDLLTKQLRISYKRQGMFFDDSYVREVELYYRLISTSPKTRTLRKSERIFVVVVASDEAITIARKRRLRVINGDLFKEALLGFKGPIRPPDDKCEHSAIRICKNRELYESRLSDKARKVLQMTGNSWLK